MESSTTILRRLLDERGVEWSKGAFPNEARTYWRDTVARPWNEQRLYVMALLTPEQAIAATLGIDRHPYEQRITGDGSNWAEIMADAFDDLIASAAESCTHDELTALESHIAATMGDDATAFAKRIEQAVENREPLTLFGVDYEVREECEVMSTEATCDFVHKRHTLSCGHVVGAYSEPPNFCPKCGRKVRKAVKR